MLIKFKMGTFQSTLPRGERRPSPRLSSQSSYFNPRSREGSDAPQGHCCARSAISIHAPARGATSDTIVFEMSEIISIHAPARGATFNGLVHVDDLFDFNPRSREGSDVAQAPNQCYHSYFNPRSREGSDSAGPPAAPPSAISIHAPARGATPSFPARSRCCRYFNPRSREGSDINKRLLPELREISIHAPARGATGVCGVSARCPTISIHAPARGATWLTVLLSYFGVIFQSTLPRGERRVSRNFPGTRRRFQSTLPRGERR